MTALSESMALAFMDMTTSESLRLEEMLYSALNHGHCLLPTMIIQSTQPNGMIYLNTKDKPSGNSTTMAIPIQDIRQKDTMLLLSY